ncbi:MAG TPA: response regulator [Phycisphaerales bacterium]|nr:response regulator [Phycisphaerales bacterium]
MGKKPVLIVDDEKNIRLTLSQALETLQLEIDTAVNGEEALAKLEAKRFGLILLDLKMPGMDGMEVLRRVRETRPDIKVIIITAHGTIDSAVEAMKLGAVDFIQKPFAPKEIRELATKVLDRDNISAEKAKGYAEHIELAKKCIGDREFDSAAEHVRQAIAADPTKAEGLNLLGALQELGGNRLEALKNYRAAIALDPTYMPATENLNRAANWSPKGDITLDEPKATDDQEEGKKA